MVAFLQSSAQCRFCKMRNFARTPSNRVTCTRRGGPALLPNAYTRMMTGEAPGTLLTCINCRPIMLIYFLYRFSLMGSA